MTQWRSQLLEKKLMETEVVIKHRRWVASQYENDLKKRGVKTVNLSEEHKPVYLRYPVLVHDKCAVLKEAKKRNRGLVSFPNSPES